MGITDVAAKRRGKTTKYIQGSVIDIGCGTYPIEKLYTGITEFKGWDIEDGDAQYMRGCKQYDIVHSSHSLEHMEDPFIALQTWIGIAKKYLVILVPDEEMYEHNIWPSKFNSDHKWSFTTKTNSTLSHSINVMSLLLRMKNVEVQKIERITFGYDPNDSSDQTTRDVECGIELILKKVK